MLQHVKLLSEMLIEPSNTLKVAFQQPGVPVLWVQCLMVWQVWKVWRQIMGMKMMVWTMVWILEWQHFNNLQTIHLSCLSDNV